MEQSGLKDERVAHIAGSERLGERLRPRLLGPRTRWLRMSGQSSFSCDRKEDPPVKKLNSQTSFPPLPPAPSIFQKMRDGACDPSPGFFLRSLRFFPFTRCSAVLARSLFWSVVPWPASPSEARADVSSALSVRSVLLSFRLIFRRLRETGVGGGVGAEAAGRCSHLLLLLRGGASSSAAAALSASGRRPAASSSFEALGKEAGLLELLPL